MYSETSWRLLPDSKSYEIEGGGIGISLARLWKREVAGASAAGTDLKHVVEDEIDLVGQSACALLVYLDTRSFQVLTSASGQPLPVW